MKFFISIASEIDGERFKQQQYGNECVLTD